MKIRIKENTIRLRLSKTDVSIFTQHGYIEKTTMFGNNIFIYALEQCKADQLTATFNNSKITLHMPVAMTTEWQATERIGFEGYDGNLFMLIEKDFQCLDNVAEDQSDNYPNPNEC